MFTSTILWSVFIFTLVTILLVTILLQAKARLAPSGPVKLDINGDTFEVESGNTLLTTLGNRKVFLPSACGGGGTCGNKRTTTLRQATAVPLLMIVYVPNR